MAALSFSLLPLVPAMNFLSDELVICKKHGSSCSCAHFCNVFYKQKSHSLGNKRQSSQGKTSRKCHLEATESKKHQTYQKIDIRNSCSVKDNTSYLTNLEPFLIKEIFLEILIYWPRGNLMSSYPDKLPCFFFNIPSPPPQI